MPLDRPHSNPVRRSSPRTSRFVTRVTVSLSPVSLIPYSSDNHFFTLLLLFLLIPQENHSTLISFYLILDHQLHLNFESIANLDRGHQPLVDRLPASLSLDELQDRVSHLSVGHLNFIGQHFLIGAPGVQCNKQVQCTLCTAPAC